tara:strand:+ start:1350 stop:1928 length:579 start_codon:yes stop_codon:yes gene_type:complete
MKNKNIVVFDFDGTLIKGDSIKLYCKWISFSLLDFILRYHFRFRLIKLFKFKYDLKHERVKYYHKKQLKKKLDINEFNSILKDHLFKDSLAILKSDQLNFEVYVVSASFSEIIESFCVNFLKVNLITNNIENYNTLTDINSKHKVSALSTNIKGDYNIVRGYGNSSGDFDFMNISDKAFLRLSNGKIIKWQK